ncbi:MAG: carbohydrate porin, partial [Gammaproteobacteria bacterium]|nr:carbohydrate porin [Gammaproteobacteria bacterium]
MIFTLLLLFFFSITLPAFALDFNGYFRSGVGANHKGGDQICFKLPGASSKYRLGNECESSATIRFSENIKPTDTAGKFKVYSTFVYESEAEKDWEQYKSTMREAYAAGTNFGANKWKQVKYWIGQRMMRKDVHITDYFYWDNSGVGAGFANLPVDRYKISYSLISNVNDTFDEQNIRTQVNNRS